MNQPNTIPTSVTEESPNIMEETSDESIHALQDAEDNWIIELLESQGQVNFWWVY